MKYERLTMINNGFIDTNCRNCKQCKKVGRKYICNDMTACNEEIINRLAELEDKIENGTLIELPCNVSDTVWYIKQDGEVIWVDEMIVKGFEFSKCNKVIFIVGTYREKAGKIYKTKAEAEKILKELKGE